MNWGLLLLSPSPPRGGPWVEPCRENTWRDEANGPATGRFLAPPGHVGDLPQEHAIEGGLLHEVEALLHLAQGLVLLCQCLLQLQNL